LSKYRHDAVAFLHVNGFQALAVLVEEDDLGAVRIIGE